MSVQDQGSGKFFGEKRGRGSSFSTPILTGFVLFLGLKNPRTFQGHSRAQFKFFKHSI